MAPDTCAIAQFSRESSINPEKLTARSEHPRTAVLSANIHLLSVSKQSYDVSDLPDSHEHALFSSTITCCYSTEWSQIDSIKLVWPQLLNTLVIWTIQLKYCGKCFMCFTISPRQSLEWLSDSYSLYCQIAHEFLKMTHKTINWPTTFDLINHHFLANVKGNCVFPTKTEIWIGSSIHSILLCYLNYRVDQRRNDFFSTYEIHFYNHNMMYETFTVSFLLCLITQ